MKKTKFLWSMLSMVMAAMLSVQFTSCSKDDKEDFSVNPSYISLSEAGGSQSIQVVGKGSWSVSGIPSWLTVSPTQGSGNGTIMVSAPSNTERNSRNCTLLISGSGSATVTVNQSGKSGSSVDDLVGSYTGTLKPIGYSDEPARCYVTLSKLSSDAVRVEKILCETFSIDMNPVNLKVSQDGNGNLTLRSETTKSIEGSYTQGQLTLTFANSLATFFFTGVKN